MLWEPRSEVYFAQKGNQMGKYLMKDNCSIEQCANQAVWTLNLKAIEQDIIYQTFGKKSSLLKSLVTNCLKTQWTVNNLVRILNPISFKAWIHHIKVQKLQCTLVNFVAFKVWFFVDWFIQPKSSRFIFHAVFVKGFSNDMMSKNNMRSCDSNGTPKPPILSSIFLAPQKGVSMYCIQILEICLSGLSNAFDL